LLDSLLQEKNIVRQICVNTTNELVPDNNTLSSQTGILKKYF